MQPLDYFWGANERNVGALLAQIGLPPADTGSDTFVADSMFWVRLSALRPLLDAHLLPSLFEPEAGQVDGTQAHAIERIVGLVVRHSGAQQQTAAQVLGRPFDDGQPYAYARKS